MAPDGYYVQGNRVLDANGAPHLFRGMDRPSLEWSPGGQNLAQTDYENMAAVWNANVVRITLNQDFWINDPANPQYSPGYATLVHQQVEDAEAAGLDVILDLHWSDQGDFAKGAACMNSGGCQQCMADTNSVTFWQQVAAAYKDDGHVLFELYNEPYKISWSTWLNGGMTGSGCTNNGGSTAQDFLAVGMQDLYETVRATGAQNLVVIGGLNWAYDLTGVPENRVKGYNIVYNTHPYSFKCGGSGNCTPAQFAQYFGFLAATDPVIATEFGDNDCSAPFYETFTNYAQANGIHWTAWAYFVGGCSFPALISNWAGDAVPGSGTTVQTALMTGGTSPRPMMPFDAGTATTATDGGGAMDAGAATDAAPND
jgi:hypothetical protein